MSQSKGAKRAVFAAHLITVYIDNTIDEILGAAQSTADSNNCFVKLALLT
jgi:hypothetical protein